MVDGDLNYIYWSDLISLESAKRISNPIFGSFTLYHAFAFKAPSFKFLAHFEAKFCLCDSMTKSSYSVITCLFLYV